MSAGLMVNCEVVYATGDRQALITVQSAKGQTVADAISASNLASLFPNDYLDSCPTGIWGRLVERTQIVKNGDRIELYRQLAKDPRIARRERAAAGQG